MRVGVRIGVGLICVAAFAAAVGSVRAAADPAEKRVALVVGESAYQNVPALRNPGNDADAMAGALKRIGFEVIEVKDAGKQKLERAVLEFGNRLASGGVGLFFYSGHGMQVNGRNYLVPVDAALSGENAVRIEATDVDLVLDQMGLAKTRVNLVILDACRNNPFERGFRSLSRGLAAVDDAPQGTLIAYSTSPGKVASDGDGANGTYTQELLKAIAVPGLPAEEVFKRVRVAVAADTNDAQTPWEASSLTGTFYFLPGESEETKQIRAQAEQARAEAEAAKAQVKEAEAQAAQAKADAQADVAELAQMRADLAQAKADAAAARAQADAETSKAKAESEAEKKKAADDLAQVQAEAAKAQADAKAAAARADAALAQAETVKGQARLDENQQVVIVSAASPPAPAPTPQAPVEPAVVTAMPRPGGYEPAPAPGACPVEGTEIETSNGMDLKFIGGEGLRCRYRDAATGTYRSKLGLMVDGGGIDEESNLAKDAMAKLWPLEVGKSTGYKFDLIGGYGESHAVTFEAKVVRQDTLTTAAGRFEVYVVSARRYQAPGIRSLAARGDGEYRQTFYIAPDLGFPVKVEYELVVGRGCDGCASWEATAISAPARQGQAIAAQPAVAMVGASATGGSPAPDMSSVKACPPAGTTVTYSLGIPAIRVTRSEGLDCYFLMTGDGNAHLRHALIAVDRDPDWKFDPLKVAADQIWPPAPGKSAKFATSDGFVNWRFRVTVGEIGPVTTGAGTFTAVPITIDASTDSDGYLQGQYTDYFDVASGIVVQHTFVKLGGRTCADFSCKNWEATKIEMPPALVQPVSAVASGSPPAHSNAFDGAWTVNFGCPAWGQTPSREWTDSFEVKDGHAEFVHGELGHPGAYDAEGDIDARGFLDLTMRGTADGSANVKRGKPYTEDWFGTLTVNGGTLAGDRDCVASLERKP